MEQPTTSSEKPSPKYVKASVKRVELVDLTLYENAQNVLLKEDSKPFKVILSFNRESGTLRIHFQEIFEEKSATSVR